VSATIKMVAKISFQILVKNLHGYSFGYTRVGALIVATIYLQLIQNRYMIEVLLSFNVVISIVYNPLPAMWKS